MKNYTFFIGVDVSKSKLDACLVSNPKDKKHQYLVVSNNPRGIAKVISTAVKLGFDMQQTLWCFENTGVYSIPLSSYLTSVNIDHWVVPAMEIKRSKGITRGKTDKTDSRDIAFYAHTHVYKAECSKLPETEILKLQLLYSEREKVLSAVLMLKTSKEAEGFLPAVVLKEIKAINASAIKKLEQTLKSIEKKLMGVVKSSDAIAQHFKLVTSVPGIGKLTAIYLIITTKAFTAFANWRKLACYSGVAPFQYSSGSSIKGRTKVHPLANKKLKTLLNMCALSAKRLDKELKAYYERKTEEGKNPMLVLNAIRCKLLARVFATINRKTPFVNLQKFAA